LALAADRNRKRKAEKDAAEAKHFKIFNLKQMDSVIREMAETQLRIDTELKVCQQRVARNVQESARILERRRRRLQHLKNAIECYFIREGRFKATEKFRFGSVQFYRGKVTADLDINKAKTSLGKP
jgi:hypothetical protein